MTHRNDPLPGVEAMVGRSPWDRGCKLVDPPRGVPTMSGDPRKSICRHREVMSMIMGVCQNFRKCQKSVKFISPRAPGRAGGTPPSPVRGFTGTSRYLKNLQYSYRHLACAISFFSPREHLIEPRQLQTTTQSQ